MTILAPTGVAADTIFAMRVIATSDEPPTVASIESVRSRSGKKENIA
jgi:hypothetical protein